MQIRKLVWTVCDNHHEEYYHALGNKTDYTVVKIGRSFRSISDDFHIDFETLLAAKHEAQKHFETEISKFLNVRSDKK